MSMTAIILQMQHILHLELLADKHPSDLFFSF